MTVTKKIIKPQPGPQEAFLSSTADIAIYGGGAGGGKTFALLLEALRYTKTLPGFGAVIFRRTSPQITNEGALWDESVKLYSLVGGTPRESKLDWCFAPFNNWISFLHLEHDKNVHDHQGAQYPMVGFDELTHFTKLMFWYLTSRNRSVCGVRPYIRATCNPDPDSWVTEFISWWIDQDTGLPIKERAGVVRWLYRVNDTLHWADNKIELKSQFPDADPIHDFKSVTFIPALVHDNQELLKVNPGYLGTLRALPLVERERLLNGNWKIRATSGTIFKRQWFEIVDYPPTNARRIRFWDRAATEKKADNDPDATSGAKVSRDVNGVIYIEHIERFFATPSKVEIAIKNTATQDGNNCTVGFWQDPGQAGKFEINYYVKALSGWHVVSVPQTKSKLSYALPLSSQVEQGNVKLVRGNWNEAFLTEAENFTGEDGCKDDQVDSVFGAYNFLASKRPVMIEGAVEDYVNMLTSERGYDG